ncbi:MAG: DMT family transporter [Proteobacteria bacterium]|nr:DMT family transporter [Pseudomonadota bacterium]
MPPGEASISNRVQERPADTRAQGPATLAGILLMCAGVSVFPFMNAASKLLAAHYPIGQIVWARFAGHLIVMLAVFLPRHGIGVLRTRHPVVQAGRSAMTLVSTLLYIMALAHVPLATAAAIDFTAPLIVTALSVPLLGETVGWRRWTAVLVGFAGALLVIRPGAGFSDPAVLMLLISALAYALYQIATRWIGGRDAAATGSIYSALLGSAVLTCALPFDFVLPRNALDIALFCALGTLGSLASYLTIRAFQLGRASVIAPLGYVELIGSAALGYLVFGNFPDAWTWIGAAVIVASGIYIALRERSGRAAR